MHAAVAQFWTILATRDPRTRHSVVTMILLAAQIESSAETSRAASTDAERVALVVLDAANAFQRKLGKGKLADILKGSHAKDVQPFVKSPHFGTLAGMRRSELDTLIQQLFDDGYLKQVGGEYPTLVLTPRGEHALKTRAAIETNVRPPEPGAADAARAEREAGGTVLLTAQLLAQGKSPEEIAAERGLQRVPSIRTSRS